ncbi:MAG TPA: hypothetical protein VIF57_29260 [Polyangia bacterium]|jgi:hypothetical protein
MTRGAWGLGVAVLGAAACAHAPPAAGPAAPAASANASGDSAIIVGDEAMRAAPSVRAVWLAYGAAKALHYETHRPPPANESADDFELELAGRTAMLDVWTEKHEKGDAELDRQVEIRRAGYLPEFVVAVHARPGWTIPGATVAGLRMEDFVKKFEGHYTTENPVAVKPAGGKVFPDVPGADFPDPKQLPVSPESCRVAVDERRAAWVRWARLEPRLGGVPVSATSTMHFARQLAAMKRDADGPPPNVTWVSERVAHLAMVDGFCAVEARNWLLAVEILTRAVALNPSSPDPRLELSSALTSLGRLADALRQADLALARAKDGCSVARAWRKRGYILVEMEAFEAARIAYEKSLAVDPGNPIALSELKTIATALAHGDWRKKPQPGGPPFDPVIVTSCRNGQPAGPAEGAGEGKPDK